jgi:hypothetical protein
MNSSAIKYRLFNARGQRFKEKFLIMQSDDWGSIRMPSNATRESLSKEVGLSTNDAYAHYDKLCSAEDLEALFGVLRKFKDRNNRHPVITANAVTANPDFEKMKAVSYESYFKEDLYQTFSRYHHSQALRLWEEGESQSLMDFQYHCREHVNVPLWLNALCHGPVAVRIAADKGVFGLAFEGLNLRKKKFQAAWDFHKEEEENQILEIIVDGLKNFKAFFKWDSVSIIAPSYTWSDKIKNLLFNMGVQDMQGIMFQKQPEIGKVDYRKRWRWTKKNKALGVGYQVRNAFFEPAPFQHKNQVGQTLFRIEQAFRMGKPAIICSHRINFAGGLDVKNQEESLKQLQQLLSEALKRWPDILFIGSSELTRIKNT